MIRCASTGPIDAGSEAAHAMVHSAIPLLPSCRSLCSGQWLIGMLAAGECCAELAWAGAMPNGMISTAKSKIRRDINCTASDLISAAAYHKASGVLIALAKIAHQLGER